MRWIGAVLICVYLNGIVSNCSPYSGLFEANMTVTIKIKRNISLDVLRQLIHEKLGLEHLQKVSQLIYRFLIQLTPLQFSVFQLNDIQDIGVMIDCHAWTCMQIFIQ